ncbi:site-specific integrase [Deinococcus planocerae]|uniref:tyrosine-type recombinase/integrase n=1 Tax=Deinococcus planocerae TaxID=1737569 RepID=UPI000C7F2276
MRIQRGLDLMQVASLDGRERCGPSGGCATVRAMPLPVQQAADVLRGHVVGVPESEHEVQQDAPLLLQKSTNSYRSGFHGGELHQWLCEFQERLHATGILPVDINFRSRDCRRIVATRLYIKKIPILDISKLLGHKHVNTTVRYIAHVGGDIARYLEEA